MTVYADPYARGQQTAKVLYFAVYVKQNPAAFLFKETWLPL